MENNDLGVGQASKRTRWVSALMAVGAMATIPVAHADIELGNGISVSGFIDMSYSSVDPEGGTSTESFGIDQVETDFTYSGTGGVSARVDIEYGEGFDGADDETFVEQAFITKAFTEEFSMSVGRFLSYTGWETEEPTGLFQFSGTGYAQYFYGFYQNGITANYNNGTFGVMGSLVTSAFDPNDRNDVDGANDDNGFEVGVALTPVEGLTAKAFYISDGDTDTDIVNTWISYAFGGFTLAAEFNTADYDLAGEGDGFLLMANYATGPWGFTLRFHDFEIEDNAGAMIDDGSAITLAPSYAIGENLLLVGEYRSDTSDTNGDSDTFALEFLFTF